MSELLFIGTSDAFGAGGRRQSAILLRGASGGVLLDCGMTTTGGLCDLQIDRGEIDTVIISHYHGDHFGGIPSLLLAALYEDGRTQPLRIAGPTGVEDRVNELCNAMGYAIQDRSWSFPIVFQDLDAGVEVEVGPVSVKPFEVHHQPHTLPHGLSVRTGRHRITYSGDTGWFGELPSRVRGSDLFITECTYLSETFEFHLDHAQLLDHKHEFDCGRIVLTHLGAAMSERRGRCAFETADDGVRIPL